MDDFPPYNPPPYQIAILVPKTGVPKPIEIVTPQQQQQQQQQTGNTTQIELPVPSEESSNPIKRFLKKYFFQGQVC